MEGLDAAQWAHDFGPAPTDEHDDEHDDAAGYDPCCGACVSGINPWHSHD